MTNRQRWIDTLRSMLDDVENDFADDEVYSGVAVKLRDERGAGYIIWQWDEVSDDSENAAQYVN